MTETMVAAHDGAPLTLSNLPSPQTRRWTPHRKAELVTAVRQNLLSLDDACARYCLSVDEFTGWARLIDRHGVPGLRVTKIQAYQ